MALVRSARELGEVVRARRKEKGLTQTQVAELTGTSLRFVTELERGLRTQASLSKVLTVCNRLALDVVVQARENTR